MESGLDLCAGPGGWDYAARKLGIDVLGIEWDAAACETRARAGLRTLKADIAALDPHDFGGIELLIASPPCPAFSIAGSGAGRRDLDTIYVCAAALSAGRDEREEARTKIADESALLAIEPFRYALALNPRYIAWEQVPPVLELWEWCADALAARGYHTWTGVLSSEQYGVPQTRERAFMLASLRGPVEPPAPTHRRYVFPRAHRGGGTEPLFTLEAQPVTRPDEEHLFPWVSMAEALGWGASEMVSDWVAARPATTIARDPRVFPPGGHIANDGRDNSRMVGRPEGAIRISIEDAAVLQGFPRDYPFSGTRTKQFQQVGNAVPPPLARAVLSALMKSPTP